MPLSSPASVVLPLPEDELRAGAAGVHLGLDGGQEGLGVRGVAGLEQGAERVQIVRQGVRCPSWAAALAATSDWTLAMAVEAAERSPAFRAVPMAAKSLGTWPFCSILAIRN